MDYFSLCKATVCKVVPFDISKGIVPANTSDCCGVVQLISNLLNVAVNYIAIPVVAVVFTWGGVELMFSQGNENKIKSAKNKLYGAVIGTVVVLAANIIVRLTFSSLGLDASQLPF